MTTVWHELVNTMRQLPPVEPGTRIITDEETPPRPLPSIEAEKNTLDTALGQLEMLIALRRNEEQAIELARHTSNNNTNVPSVLVSGGTPTHKRKRRTSLSYSASPAPMGDVGNVVNSLLSPLPRGGTPAGREAISKKKDGDGGLGIGRKVAFRAKRDEEEWILTTVQKRDTNDKNKYTVLDQDDGA